MTQEPKIFPYIARLLQGAEVVWKPLGEVCKILRGKRLTKKELSDEGIYPVFHGGLIPLGHYNSYNRKGNQTMVINTGSIGEVVWSGVDFWSSDGTFVVETNDVIEDKFLYYYLKTKEQYLKSQKREGGVPTIDRSVVEKLSIPLPPLSVQQEIVRILDKFTQLEAELEAELDCRKRQYEYYRNNLLSYEGNEVEWKTLGEVFEIIAGGDIPKDALSEIETNEYNIPILSNGINEKAIYGWTNISKINKPSLTISARGTIGWASYREQPFFPIVRLLVLTPLIEINLRYAYNFMKSIENDYKVPKVGIPQLTKPMIKDLKIPLPSLSEQQRIASILDKFDTLVNSISEGLPKEIALRRKQYEYYREKLLTFINNQ